MPVIYGVSDETVREILTTVRTIAVVGASPNPARPSNEVLGYLVAKGFETYPVNPWHAGGLIRGRPTYARLADVPAESTWSTSFAVRAARRRARSTTRSTATPARRDPGATRRTDGSLKELPRRRGRTTPSIAAPRNDGGAIATGGQCYHRRRNSSHFRYLSAISNNCLPEYETIAILRGNE